MRSSVRSVGQVYVNINRLSRVAQLSCHVLFVVLRGSTARKDSPNSVLSVDTITVVSLV